MKKYYAIIGLLLAIILFLGVHKLFIINGPEKLLVLIIYFTVFFASVESVHSIFKKVNTKLNMLYLLMCIPGISIITIMLIRAEYIQNKLTMSVITSTLFVIFFIASLNAMSLEKRTEKN